MLNHYKYYFKEKINGNEVVLLDGSRRSLLLREKRRKSARGGGLARGWKKQKTDETPSTFPYVMNINYGINIIQATD